VVVGGSGISEFGAGALLGEQSESHHARSTIAALAGDLVSDSGQPRGWRWTALLYLLRLPQLQPRGKERRRETAAWRRREAAHITENASSDCLPELCFELREYYGSNLM
jgi:hypothetical protein